MRQFYALGNRYSIGVANHSNLVSGFEAIYLGVPLENEVFLVRIIIDQSVFVNNGMTFLAKAKEENNF